MNNSNTEAESLPTTASEISPAIAVVQKLGEAPDVPDSVRTAARLYLNEEAGLTHVRTIVMETIRAQRYEHFEEALVLMRAFESEFLNDGELLALAGFAAWVRRSAEECEHWSKRLIALYPGAFNGYLRLGLNYLSSQRPMDAFLAFSAGLRNASDSRHIETWWKLSEQMVRGNDETVFEKWGHSFRFRLSCFSTQAIEADAVHVSGQFTEEAELAFLATALQGCKHILEVGTLVGNHSVCLATMVRPKSLHIVDANRQSIEETRHNLSLNRESFPETELTFRHAALAGPETKMVTIQDKVVETVTLDAVLAPEIDFVKIDVDGMEEELLDPLCRLLPERNCRLMIEVENPMKSGFVERMSAIGYMVDQEFAHGGYTNLFFVPPRQVSIPRM